MSKKNKLLMLLFGGVIACFIVIIASINAKPQNQLKRSIQNLKQNQEVTLEKVVPFKWNKVYSFWPYTSKESMEKTIGFKSKKLRSNSINDNISSYVFVKDKKVVAQITGYSSNLTYEIDFCKRNMIKNGEKLKFKVKKDKKITILELMNKKNPLFPLKADTKDLYNSKYVMYYSLKDQKWDNFYLYQSFKKKVDKKENASFRLIQNTKEGDPIIYDVYYDKKDNFTVIKDNRRDEFSALEDRKIFERKYKNLFEAPAMVDYIDRDGGFMTMIVLSNKNTLSEADADSTLDTIRLFSYKPQK